MQITLRKYQKCLVTFFGTVFLSLCAAHAQRATGYGLPGIPSVFYFRVDKTEPDTAYMDNSLTLLRLNALLSDSTRTLRIDSIHIHSFASPEGGKAYNDRLALERGEAMKSYLLHRYPLTGRCPIRLFPHGENWEGFRELVTEDSRFPEREEVLMILDAVKDPEKQKALFKRLNAGIAYRYLKSHILPPLRNATVCTVYTGSRITGNTEIVRPPAGYGKTAQTALARIAPLPEEPPVAPRRPVRYSALKTNLVAWAASAVNLAYEVQTGRHFSIDLPLVWSSWDIPSWRHALRVIAFQPELRYWPSRPGQGFFLGLHAHAARYNLKRGDTRYQDTRRPLLGAGVSLGCSFPLKGRWGMELNLGAGYADTHYNLYRNLNDVSKGQLSGTRTLNYWGVTRIGVSFVYRLNVKKGKP